MSIECHYKLKTTIFYSKLNGSISAQLYFKLNISALVDVVIIFWSNELVSKRTTYSSPQTIAIPKES
jgi:hypothetical protein